MVSKSLKADDILISWMLYWPKKRSEASFYHSDKSNYFKTFLDNHDKHQQKSACGRISEPGK